MLLNPAACFEGNVTERLRVSGIVFLGIAFTISGFRFPGAAQLEIQIRVPVATRLDVLECNAAVGCSMRFARGLKRICGIGVTNPTSFLLCGNLREAYE